MEQQKTETTARTFEEIFLAFEKGIKEAESLKETDPERFEVKMHRLSQLYKQLLNQDRFFTSIHIGMMNFHDRAKRRSTRKPLTIRKMKSLNDDLKTLASILKI